MQKPGTPVLDRLLEYKPKINAVAEFLEWLHGQGYVLGGHQYHRSDSNVHDFGFEDKDGTLCICDELAAECFGMVEDCPWPHKDWLWRQPIRDRSVGIRTLLGQYFEIDENEMQQERMALLEWVRSQNQAE